MKDIVIIFVLCIVAIFIGGWMYFGMPEQPFVPGTTSQMSNDGSPDATPTVTTEGVVEFMVIDQGDHATGYDERKNLAIYDETEFAALWEKIHPEDPLASVDFTSEYVIAVFAGEKSSGGHTITVEKVTENDTTRTVSILMSEPAADCIVTQAITSPYHIIKVPLTSALPKSVERTEIVACS